MPRPLHPGARRARLLAAVVLAVSACASSRTPQELQAVTIEVLNNLGPSSEVRVDIIPVENRHRSVLLGWVPLGEVGSFRTETAPGRYYLVVTGRSHGQTRALRPRNPRSTDLVSERFTIDGPTGRIVWNLGTNHLQVQQPGS